MLLKLVLLSTAVFNLYNNQDGASVATTQEPSTVENLSPLPIVPEVNKPARLTRVANQYERTTTREVNRVATVHQTRPETVQDVYTAPQPAIIDVEDVSENLSPVAVTTENLSPVVEIEETTVETPTVAETVVEAPKVEETVVEEMPTVAETPKVEEVPVEETVVETPKVEETVVETPKVEEAVAETPNVVETPKVEETVAETPKVEEAPTAETVVETPKVEETVSEEAPNVEETVAEEAPKVEETVAEEPIAEAVAEEASYAGGDLLSNAAKYVGTPYVWGGKTPDGFDCSGFTQYVYKETYGIDIGGWTVPQESSGTRIAAGEAQPGDLYFWGADGATYHVAIATGGGNYIHASQPGTDLGYGSSEYFTPDFAVRVHK